MKKEHKLIDKIEELIEDANYWCESHPLVMFGLGMVFALFIFLLEGNI
ncbi:MAG: hypothetical protein ACRCXT_15785 [Paraclostridium sp.]